MINIYVTMYFSIFVISPENSPHFLLYLCKSLLLYVCLEPWWLSKLIKKFSCCCQLLFLLSCYFCLHCRCAVTSVLLFCFVAKKFSDFFHEIFLDCFLILQMEIYISLFSEALMKYLCLLPFSLFWRYISFLLWYFSDTLVKDFQLIS